MAVRSSSRIRHKVIFAFAFIVTMILIALLTGCNNRISPEDTVDEYINAIGKADMRKVLTFISPQEIEDLKQAYGEDYTNDILESSSHVIFPFPVQFEDMEYTTKISGDRASLKITGGKVIASARGQVANMEMNAESVKGDPRLEELYNSTFELIKVDGKWYLYEVFEWGEIAILINKATDEEVAAIRDFLAGLPQVDPERIAYQSTELPTSITIILPDPGDAGAVKEEILDNIPYKERLNSIMTIYFAQWPYTRV